MAVVGRRFDIRGTVQGVGFRPWVYRLAQQHGLTGWVRNDASGVTVEVFGGEDDLADFARDIRTSPPPAARIDDVHDRPATGPPPHGFTIVASAVSDERRMSIPPDLATCEDCVAEIFDPTDRRHRYPFTNCTNCGPRFTIAQGVPYDRPHTTMARFRMCAACQVEYDDPADRRFHAQPNACPRCGPQLWIQTPDGGRVETPDPVAMVVDALCDGRTVAIKGLGGYHLACDATNPTAVARLRQRKRRDERPFAVMVATLAEAETLADLGPEDRRLLQSIERPIVIVSRAADARLASNVAPDNPTVGLMLPYTPLHHLILRAVARPLVMTSGNVSDEPLAYRNDEALATLRAIADLFLVHDRDIDTRCDDSVARVIGGSPTVFRRSRGYTPRPILVPFRFTQPTLAVGALLKNTFAVGVDDQVCLGPHIGDLENLETYESFVHAIERMETFLGVRAAVIAHDLHPDYLSTRYALARAAEAHVGVQHHHAHVASAMAEHGLTGPVVGVAFDGTGFGPDGSAWGGEFLWVESGRYERVASCRPLALPGGDLAVRQVWRQALAAVLDAFDGDAPLDRLALFAQVDARDVAVVRQMIAAKLHTPPAHGAGRLFDAAGAIGLARTVSRHEGHIALAWNLIADPAETGQYPFAWHEGVLRLLDCRPLFRALVDDALAGVAPATMSGRFHNSLAAAIVEEVAAIRRARGEVPVVLSGGCFQNARLTETVVKALGSAVQVVRHRLVPPGDGGVALGQATVAHAILDAGGPSVPEGLCA